MSDAAANKGKPKGKSIFRSRTFWANVGFIAANAAGLPIPPSVTVPVVTIGNIILRLMTKDAVSVTASPRRKVQKSEVGPVHGLYLE